jgi:hypothetical protein
LWQSSQVLPLAIWFWDLPAAVVPLWQLKQLPIISLWSFLASGLHAMVRWQLSQVLVVLGWLAGLWDALTRLARI